MRRKRLTIGLIGAGLVLFIILVAVAVVVLQRQRAVLPASVGPTVLITSPAPNDSAAASSAVAIEAAAYGDHPIHHMELWLDGEQVQTFYNQDLQGSAPVEITFYQLLTSGGHVLFVRAVDSHALIGQSLPITAQGTMAIAGEGPFTLITIEPGSTLDETLAAHDTDVAAVLPHNPGLSGGASPGTTIAIPVQPEGGPQENPPDTNPPAPPGNAKSLDILDLLPGLFPTFQLIPAEMLGPPSAPASLQASVSDCSVKFTWTDTSEQEAGFNIWFTGLGVPPRVAARTKAGQDTGPVSVELPAVGAGDFVYWVEAYNVAGAQPSNQVFVSVSGPCTNQLGSTMTIEALDFSVPAQYDRAYCYISLQGNPEIRLPGGQDQFMQVSGGKGDLTSLPLLSRSYSMAVPGDPSLSVEGQCWGWAGGSLSKLGGFSQAITQPQWDGTRVPLNGSIFEIGLSVSVSQAGGEVVTFSAPDPGIAPPKILTLEAPITLGDVGLDPFETLDYLDRGNLRTLTWEWFPSPPGSTTLTGFTILINGIPFKQIASPAARNAEIRVPGFCGTKLEISLVANIDERASLPSNVVSDEQPTCPLYAVVDFETVHFGWTNDSLHYNARCDTLDTYFQISVTETFVSDIYNSGADIQGRKWVKSFNGGNYFQEIACGIYDMNTLAGSFYTKDELNVTRFDIPIRFVEGLYTDYSIEATIWDHDNWPNPDDRVAQFSERIHFAGSRLEGFFENMTGHPKALLDYYSDGQVRIFNGDAKSRIDVRVHLYPTNPSTGVVQLPANTSAQEPSTTEPPDSAGLQFKPISDVAVTDMYIDADGGLYVRVRNEGPDDMVKARLNMVTTIQTDDPNVWGSPYTHASGTVNLKKEARKDLYVSVPKLDPTQYSYTITVEVSVEGSSEPDLTNNTHTAFFSVSDLQVFPDPLLADLQIAEIRADSNGNLIVVVRDAGPDVIGGGWGVEATVTCEATRVSRMAGTATTIKGLEESKYLNLDVGSTSIFTPIGQGFEFNLLTNWFIFSCQVKSNGAFMDPNPANNFSTQTVQ